MNKKGFTMVELMVSISLIAIIMVFLVQLLLDVRYELINELFDTTDQTSRAEIIKTIQSDLNGKNITDIKGSKVGDGSIGISIVTTSGTATIRIDEGDNLIYTSYGGYSKKWALKGKEANPETHYKKTNLTYKVLRSNDESSNSNDYLIQLRIPVLIDNSVENDNNGKKDSKMDDIILTFYGYSSTGLETNGTILD